MWSPVCDAMPPWDIYISPTPKAGGTLRKKGWKDCRSHRLGRYAKKQGLLDMMPLSSGNHCSYHGPHKSGPSAILSLTGALSYETPPFAESLWGKPGLQIDPAIDSILVLQRIKI